MKGKCCFSRLKFSKRLVTFVISYCINSTWICSIAGECVQSTWRSALKMSNFFCKDCAAATKAHTELFLPCHFKCTIRCTQNSSIELWLFMLCSCFSCSCGCCGWKRDLLIFLSLFMSLFSSESMHSFTMSPSGKGLWCYPKIHCILSELVCSLLRCEGMGEGPGRSLILSFEPIYFPYCSG